MSKLLPKKQQGVTAPCFLQEFCDVCGTKNSWPQDICQKSASEFLLNGYMAATGLRWQRTLSGQHSPQISKTCFASLQLGDLLPEQAKWHDFHTFSTNFSNSPPSKMSMCANGTYIGVGVNDLRLLLDASIEEGAVGMRFVGIDLNDFAVARSLVITAMLRNSDIPVTHILQVWYSSTWSWETVSSFKQTLSVMEFPKKSSRVKQLLEFWKSAEAPDLRSSRQKWLNYFVSEERKYASGMHVQWPVSPGSRIDWQRANTSSQVKCAMGKEKGPKLVASPCGQYLSISTTSFHFTMQTPFLLL